MYLSTILGLGLAVFLATPSIPIISAHRICLANPYTIDNFAQMRFLRVGLQMWPPGPIAPCDGGSHKILPLEFFTEKKERWPGVVSHFKRLGSHLGDLCGGQKFLLHYDQHHEPPIVLEFQGKLYPAHDITKSVPDGQSCNYSGTDCGYTYRGLLYWQNIPGLCDGYKGE